MPAVSSWRRPQACKLALSRRKSRKILPGCAQPPGRSPTAAAGQAPPHDRSRADAPGDPVRLRCGRLGADAGLHLAVEVGAGDVDGHEDGEVG